MPQPTSRLALRLTPRGHLLLDAAEDAPPLDDRVAERLAAAFARGAGHGLLQLGAGEIGRALPASFVWWRGFAARFVEALCLLPMEARDALPSRAIPAIPRPGEGDLASLVLTAPMMPGAEYLGPDVLLALWAELGTALRN